MPDKWDQYVAQPKDKWDQYAAGGATEGPVQGPPEEMPGEEAEASGMQTIAKEHPGLIAGASLANLGPLAAMAPEVVPTVGRAVYQGAKKVVTDPRVQGAAGLYLSKYLPSWARPIGEIMGITRMGSRGPEPEEPPPPDNINYERNQQLNRRAITSAPSGREVSGPATSSPPIGRPIPGVPQPEPAPEPPADTIDYERNQRLNRANLTRSIGSTEPSGPATGAAPARRPTQNIGESPASDESVTRVPESTRYPARNNQGPKVTYESVPGDDLKRMAARGDRGAQEELLRRGRHFLVTPNTIGRR